MSVKKIIKKINMAPKVANANLSKDNSSLNCDFSKKIFTLILGVLLLYLIIWLGALTRNTLKQHSYIGLAEKSERTITLEAQGKVTAIPDIAVTSMGMIAEGESVEEAQANNTSVMNDLIDQLKQIGIEKKDIQTANYNIYPKYRYDEEEGRILDGYEVSQSVTIKIRELDKASNVLALAGKVGANTVSGLSFTIDDTEVYNEQARQEAIAKVYKKAVDLSNQLGVKIIGVVSYNEYSSSQGYDSYKTLAEGYGGYGMSPEIEEGSTDVILNVSVTFEIER